MKWISLALLFGAFTANAATIAVIDSGLDYKHDMIVPNLWINTNEVLDNRDNDGNGYQDDINGWNFAEQNGQIIDYKYLGTFSPDCSRYFDIQGKRFLNLATEEEMTWIRAKVADPKFIKEMGKFGNFVHGTHVAGITIKGTNSKVMGIKLIPTETKLWATKLTSNANMKALDVDRWALLETAFNALAEQQMKMLADIGKFAAGHKADVANGSFGTGFNQSKMITDNAFKLVFFKKPTEEESKRAASMFIGALVKHGQSFVGAAPEMLFVFAAGNDGMSNDDFGTSPANIKADNVITVGATYKDEFFAPFSNYGVKMVDVAAPGMLIKSSIPGNEYLAVSGTSQASPYVANLAGQVKEANSRLKPVDIKKILMGTVDKKAFLADKVTAGGIVNMERAVVAAQLSKTLPVAEAIARAKSMVKTNPSLESKSVVNAAAVKPIPMSPMFR